MSGLQVLKWMLAKYYDYAQRGRDNATISIAK